MKKWKIQENYSPDRWVSPFANQVVDRLNKLYTYIGGFSPIEGGVAWSFPDDENIDIILDPYLFITSFNAKSKTAWILNKKFWTLSFFVFLLLVFVISDQSHLTAPTFWKWEFLEWGDQWSFLSFLIFLLHHSTSFWADKKWKWKLAGTQPTFISVSESRSINLM